MKLYLLKENDPIGKVYFRFWSSKSKLIWTGIPERAALFLDISAAQDVADELYLLDMDFIVVGYEEHKQ